MDSFDQAGGTAGAEPGATPVPAQAGATDEPAVEDRWWRVGCRDVANAPRNLTVLVNRDRVVLAGPPGTTAVLTAGATGRLSSALRHAADQARK